MYLAGGDDHNSISMEFISYRSPTTPATPTARKPVTKDHALARVETKEP